jgi:RecB family endonuclease NucS
MDEKLHQMKAFKRQAEKLLEDRNIKVKKISNRKKRRLRKRFYQKFAN